MIVVIVIAVAAVLAAVLVGLRFVTSSGAPLEVDGEENWLLRHAPSGLQRTLRTLDRRVVGGVAVGASFVVVFVGAAVVGWIFSGLDNQRGIARWDVAAAEYGRDRATPGSTDVLDAVTDLGGTMYVLGLMVLVGAYHSVRRRDWGPLLYLGVVGIGVTLLNNGLKLVVDRDRPDIAQLAGHAGSSFPSGHSAVAAACWAAMALVVARRQSSRVRVVAAVVAVFVAGAVAVTRVLLGVHWLSDVVAGLIVGWSWFGVVTIVFGGRLLQFGEPAERLSSIAPARSPHEESLSSMHIDSTDESVWWKATWPLARPDWMHLGVALAAVIAAGVVVGEVLTHWSVFAGLIETDQRIAEDLAAGRTESTNDLAHWSAFIADTPVKIGISILIAALLLWKFRRWHDAVMIGLPLIFEATAFIIITFIVKRPRPDVERLLDSPVDSSFPSGHVAAATVYAAIAIVVFWHTRAMWARALAVVLALAVPLSVAWARMYQGMHFLTDVIAGVVLGVVSIAICWRILGPPPEPVSATAHDRDRDRDRDRDQPKEHDQIGVSA